MSAVDETFDAIVAAEEDKRVEVQVGGETFHLVPKPAAGALLIMMRRLDDKDTSKQMAAVVRLLEKWVVPDEHEALWEAIEGIETVAELNLVDLPKIIEAAAARPT